MRHKVAKRSRKKNRKKIKAKTYSRKNAYSKTIDLKKVVGFKFQSFGKFYQNFTEKRKKERARLDKLKDKNREKQIKEEQKRLKEEEKQLTKEEEARSKEINIARIEQERKIREEQE